MVLVPLAIRRWPGASLAGGSSIDGMEQPVVSLQLDRVFVYGTLKRGQPNHHWLAGAPCQGLVRLENVLLHDLGPFPMAIHGDGVVVGELYQIDAEMLASLDRLEGVPRLYQRWRCQPLDSPWAWVYLGRPHQVRHSPVLVDGCWRGSR